MKPLKHLNEQNIPIKNVVVKNLLKIPPTNKDAGNKAAAVLSLVGLVNIVIIKKSVEWWNTLHQPASM
jgi:hypothetical protein